MARKKAEFQDFPESKRSFNARTRREKLLDAGLEQFQTIGYFASDIKGICAAAGLAAGTFYLYFPDKKTLYLAVYEREYTRIAAPLFSEEMAAVLPALSTRQIISLFIKKHYAAHTHTGLFYREASALAATDPAIGELDNRLSAEMVKNIGLLLKQNRKKIRLMDFDIAAIIIYRALEENIHALRQESDQKLIEKTLDGLIEMVSMWLSPEK
jgi:AcrR family transcriptional regulator